MLPALCDEERSLVFRWALLIAGAACALAPLNGSSSNTSVRLRTAGDSLSARYRLSTFHPQGFQVARDPFVPQAADLPANAVVRAVLLGETPHALIETGNRTILVGIGDVFAGVRITRIDDGGVLLSDGSRILLPGVP
jgi:hypothetical protein